MAYFVDDGFSMGIAFFLSVLRQNRAFGSLHWFESVESKFLAERTEAAEQLKKIGQPKSRVEAQDIQTLQFRGRRLQAQIDEFRALQFSTYAARIFFKSSDEYDERALAAHGEESLLSLA